MQREHGAVAGDDEIGFCGEGALEDAVVRLVSEDMEGLGGHN